MKTQKLLTKSRFKVALECPTKLFYLDKKEYANQSLEDSFLQALAEGGFQVGELAKYYYKFKKDGYGKFIQTQEILEKDYDTAVKITNDFLKNNKDIIIFEAAFRYKDLFVKTDVLEKRGNNIRILEVKAKSYDDNDVDTTFLSEKTKFIRSNWKPYLYDIAFQNYVVTNSLKESKIIKSPKITPYLMLADKNMPASGEGLNQLFLVLRDENGKPQVKITKEITLEMLGDNLLIEIEVANILKKIYEDEEGKEFLGEVLEGFPKKKKNEDKFKIGFEEFIDKISKDYKKDKKINIPLGVKCKTCEFFTKEGDTKLKSGFEECWKEKAGFKKNDFKKQLVYNVWNYRGANKKIIEKKYFMDDLEKSDFEIKESIEGHDLPRNERQWLQVEKYKNKDNTPYIFKNGLKEEMKRWQYPLHFIDFETTAVALPFNKGISPYEGIAFQFSHHIVYEDGSIEHKGQYINDKKGVFPCFEFVRALKNELDKDDGTIFRYAVHENTYLNIIYRQLKVSNEADKEILMKWIQSITTPVEKKGEFWESPRNMIDMCVIVQNYHYDPYTNGSNSIKKVLPAVLNASEFLQKKYIKPIYGAENGIKSLNYKDWVWIEYDKDKKVKDPYQLLPPVFDKETDEKLNDEDMLKKIYGDDSIHGGGEAMTAYARMQFSEVSDSEREKIKSALLKYCELDTFAMVLIWEYWNDIINK